MQQKSRLKRQLHQPIELQKMKEIFLLAFITNFPQFYWQTNPYPLYNSFLIIFTVSPYRFLKKAFFHMRVFYISDWSFISNNHSKHSRHGLFNFRSRKHAPIFCCSTLREQWSTSYMQQPWSKSCRLCLQPLTTNWVRSGKYLKLFLVQKHQ